ncbi:MULTISPECIES: hypothetical protein [Nostocales]|uniref:Uncharacterized protein n=1 Tax=Dolichospermum flos-aquae UHCC 0037 TaxID=2590026 RepID=A0ACC7S8I8_DOLFA|nr:MULTISPECIES: hypothetical protein [Nostocales]MBO1065194.1 hypothetical protein [Anabaena sp. 54]MTJ44825.1 hypothetical protein [Dolichospermum flos-aquae UHCC 0037]
MAIWIITTGNSDVQLKTDDNWCQFYYKQAKKQEPLKFCNDEDNKLLNIQQDNLTQFYPVPARVLGLAYKNKFQDNFEDLAFPLLDTFFEYFNKDDIHGQIVKIPNKIIVLLTDQSSIFDTQQKYSYPESPYWQDTIELEPILKEYFDRNLKKINIQCEKFLFKTLKPQSDKEGLDNWEYTLSLVEETIHKAVEEIDYNSTQEETVYISHQAGTPAISSAVQFVSLGKFNNVQFLVSNPSYHVSKLEYKSQPIDSSKYARGIQIQKAKQLIESGLPGAALNILDTINIDENVKEELIELVRFFNIETELVKSGKFDPKSAIERVVKALELVSCYFQEQSYIQGITLLAAAHETFLKAAIIKELSNQYSYFYLSVNGNSKRLQVTKVIEWTRGGLGFVKDPKDTEVWDLDNHLKKLLGITNIENIKSYKLDILKQLSFPTHDHNLSKKFNKNRGKDDKNDHGNFSVIGSNTGMLAWLKQLSSNSSNFTSWDLMEFIGQYDREFEDDRRNQLMHNLVGAKPKEVIKYLLGNQDNSKYTDYPGVINAYEKEVKAPFLEQIKKLGLPYKESDLRKQLEEIASKLR